MLVPLSRYLARMSLLPKMMQGVYPPPQNAAEWLDEVNALVRDIENGSDNRTVAACVVWAMRSISVSADYARVYGKACEVLISLASMDDEVRAFLCAELCVADVLAASAQKWIALKPELRLPISAVVHQLAIVQDREKCRDLYEAIEFREQRRIAALAGVLHPRVGADSWARALPIDSLRVVRELLYARDQDHRSMLARAGLCSILDISDFARTPRFYYALRAIADRPDCRLRVAQAAGAWLVEQVSLVPEPASIVWPMLIALTDTLDSAMWLGAFFFLACARIHRSAHAPGLTQRAEASRLPCSGT